MRGCHGRSTPPPSLESPMCCRTVRAALMRSHARSTQTPMRCRSAQRRRVARQADVRVTDHEPKIRRRLQRGHDQRIGHGDRTGDRGHSAECASGAGVLFDAEPVVAGAPAVLDYGRRGGSDRRGRRSFFESLPPGGDAYVLKHIVHDWDESKVLEILRNVRSAMAANTKLLVALGDRNRDTRRRSRAFVQTARSGKCWSPAPERNARPRSTRTC